MKQKKPFLCFFILTVLLVTGWTGRKGLAEPIYDRIKTVSYSFNLRNTTNQVLTDAVFRTYAPVSLTSAQRCCLRLESSHPYQLETDDLGNQVLKFEFNQLPPYITTMVRVTAELAMASEPNKNPNLILQRYLDEEPLIESDHPEIKTVAAKLQTGESMETMENIYAWVNEHVRDSGYLREARGALYALQNKQGDCTENAYLFAALARANGIESRPVGGYFIENNGLLKAAAYHEWAEFNDQGTWRLADPQMRVFNGNYPNYVAMHILDNRDDALFSFARFQHSGNGLTVTMN